LQRWEMWTALGAVILASASALEIPGHLWYAAVAIVLLAAVGGAQLRRALTKPRRQKSGSSSEELARRIREQRHRR